MKRIYKILLTSLTGILVASTIIILPVLITSLVRSNENHISEVNDKTYVATNDTSCQDINNYLKSQSVSLFFAKKVDYTNYEGSQGTGWLLPYQEQYIETQINNNKISDISIFVATNVHVINNIYNDFDKLFFSFFETPNSTELINGLNEQQFVSNNQVSIVDPDNFLRNIKSTNWPVDIHENNPPAFWQDTFFSQDNQMYVKKSYNDICVLQISIPKNNSFKQLLSWIYYGAMYQTNLDKNHTFIDNSNEQNTDITFYIGGFPVDNNKNPTWTLIRFPYIRDTSDNIPTVGITSSFTWSNKSNFMNSTELNVNIKINNDQIYGGTYKDTSKQLTFKNLDIGSGSSGSMIMVANGNKLWSLSLVAIWWGKYTNSSNVVYGTGNFLKTNSFHPTIQINADDPTDIVWSGYDFINEFKQIIKSASQKLFI